MSVDRKAMIAILKQSFVPEVRRLGFKGGFPSFFRETGAFVALVNVQFSSSGGSLCVNLGYADPERRNVTFAPETLPDKLKVSQCRDWVRLGAGKSGDRWFVFNAFGASPYRGEVQPAEAIAAQCAELLVSEAEAWWAAKRGG